MNVLKMWDHTDLMGTESRFRAALETATGDIALILQTQIARTYGIRKQFAEAQTLLCEVQPHLGSAGPEATANYWLEWGRTLSSATHSPVSQTDESRQAARKAFTCAFETARAAKLDYLALDALHMIGFVETEPEALLEWNRKALRYMEASSDVEARRWEGSLRNNLGYALHNAGQLQEALEQFKLALAVRQQKGEVGSIRVAHWMVAWTLRGLLRFDEAIALQLQLETECNADGQPDPYVYEELAALYAATGDDTRAAEYQAKQRAIEP